MSSGAIVDLHGLTRVFGGGGGRRPGRLRGRPPVRAVDDMTWQVQPGEAVGYIGANGAGKSTTIKMLTGILVPTAGSIRVGGLVPHERRIDNARQIGVVFGQRTQLWWDLPVRESLALIRDIHGMSARRYEQTLEHLDHVLDLSELLPVMARKLSLGQRMRADLAAALLHGPRIVYLDEPTIGLDIAVKDKVREFVRALAADGVTVMLTTHDLGDIEDICQRIVIVDEGRKIYDGSLETVKDTFARDRTIRFSVRKPVALDGLAGRLPAATVRTGDSERDLEVQFDRFALTAGEVLTEVLAVADVVDIEIDEPAIEHVIRKVYSGELHLPPVEEPA